MKSFCHNRLRSLAAVALLLLTGGLSACVLRDDLALLRLSSVESVHRDGGESLRLYGQGLPLGREGTVTWTGSLRRPGMAPRSVVVRTRARVVAVEMLEVPIDSETLAAFLGGGTFEGSARVSFDARIGAAEITGELDEVRVWVRSLREQPLALSLRYTRRAHAFAHFAGMTVSDEEAHGGGVRVQEVANVGAAARAGIMNGDVIVKVDDAFIEGVADLLPMHNADRVHLEIHRLGEVAPVSVWISLGGFENQPPRSDLWLGLALLAYVLLTTLFFGPATRAARTAVVRMREAWLTRELTRSFLPAFAAIGVSATMIIASAFVPFLQHVWLWALAAMSARIAAHLASRRALRTLSSYRVVAEAAIAAAAMVILGALVGTEAIRSFGSLQGERIWTWFALRNPIALLSAWICIEAALVGTHGRQEETRFVRIAGQVHNAIFVGLIVIMYFGGVHAPSFTDEHLRWPWLVSASVFALKVGVLAMLADRLHSTQALRSRVLVVAAGIAALALVAFMRLPLTPVQETLIAQLTTAGVAILALRYGWLAYRTRARAAAQTIAIVSEPPPANDGLESLASP